ncbi:MAG TPA: bifunctional 4-hydroxy-2-oxoglutarate aldolase/2-dehydro-3-deoxy-phosphogluconate aldolase [Fimbriimonas sp.]|nr:bifunctional 4-hydroxy-2-oxoglutarate aldolase/2-dehydro-3-deoxy-phosphogluconate aldolase [Fimbriimonas sp.]
MNKTEVMEWIKRTKLVPVVRATSPEEAMTAISALAAGGVDVVEITMTVPGAIDVIRQVSDAMGDRVLVGAGTVLDPETADACIAAGAKFIVSPSLNLETVRHCVAKQVFVAPGCLTPTEVHAGWSAGADVIKIFPADAVGGPSYIKNLRGPFPSVQFMPTGGVSLSTIKDFLAAGAVAVGVGSNLVDLKLLREQGPDALSALAAEFVKAAQN